MSTAAYVNINLTSHDGPELNNASQNSKVIILKTMSHANSFGNKPVKQINEQAKTPMRFVELVNSVEPLKIKPLSNLSVTPETILQSKPTTSTPVVNKIKKSPAGTGSKKKYSKFNLKILQNEGLVKNDEIYPVSETLIDAIGEQNYHTILNALCQMTNKALRSKALSAFFDSKKSPDKETPTVETNSITRFMEDLLDESAVSLDYNSNGYMPIHMAVFSGKLQLVERCVFVLKFNQVSIDQYSENGYTPLHLAIMEDSSPVLLKLLLQKGCSQSALTNKLHNSLHLAVVNNTHETLFTLLCQVRVNQLYELLTAEDIDGHTPLMMCMLQGKVNHAEVLLKRSSALSSQLFTAVLDFNSSKFGLTALDYVIALQPETVSKVIKVECIKLLMKYGANSKTSNYNGTIKNTAQDSTDTHIHLPSPKLPLSLSSIKISSAITIKKLPHQKDICIHTKQDEIPVPNMNSSPQKNLTAKMDTRTTFAPNRNTSRPSLYYDHTDQVPEVPERNNNRSSKCITYADDVIPTTPACQLTENREIGSAQISNAGLKVCLNSQNDFIKKTATQQPVLDLPSNLEKKSYSDQSTLTAKAAAEGNVSKNNNGIERRASFNTQNVMQRIDEPISIKGNSLKDFSINQYPNKTDIVHNKVFIKIKGNNTIEKDYLKILEPVKTMPQTDKCSAIGSPGSCVTKISTHNEKVKKGKIGKKFKEPDSILRASTKAKNRKQEHKLKSVLEKTILLESPQTQAGNSSQEMASTSPTVVPEIIPGNSSDSLKPQQTNVIPISNTLDKNAEITVQAATFRNSILNTNGKLSLSDKLASLKSKIVISFPKNCGNNTNLATQAATLNANQRIADPLNISCNKKLFKCTKIPVSPVTLGKNTSLIIQAVSADHNIPSVSEKTIDTGGNSYDKPQIAFSNTLASIEKIALTHKVETTRADTLKNKAPVVKAGNVISQNTISEKINGDGTCAPVDHLKLTVAKATTNILKSKEDLKSYLKRLQVNNKTHTVQRLKISRRNLLLMIPKKIPKLVLTKIDLSKYKPNDNGLYSVSEISPKQILKACTAEGNENSLKQKDTKRKHNDAFKIGHKTDSCEIDKNINLKNVSEEIISENVNGLIDEETTPNKLNKNDLVHGIKGTEVTSGTDENIVWNILFGADFPKST